MKIKVKNLSVQIADGFMKMNSMPDDPEDSVVYGNECSTMTSFMLLFPISKENVMPFGRLELIINGIHNSLADDQGLIEVNSGKTKSGIDYIYSIIKTKKQPSGVQYTLRGHFNFNSKEPLEVLAFFDEAGITGQRDAIIFELARHKNIVDKNMNGWMADPYSVDYKKGFLMNLSEQRKYDEHFPGHPLTELRKFIDFFIENN